MITLKVEGFAELERNLRKLPEEIAGKVLHAAWRKAVTPIARDAAQFAPRSDNPSAAGHMADSIKVRNLKTESFDNDIESSLWIGPDRKHFYAMFHEFGTVNHGAEPFLRPAFDEGAEDAIETFGRELWKGIERAAKRLHR